MASACAYASPAKTGAIRKTKAFSRKNTAVVRHIKLAAARGKDLRIEIPSNPTTGYSWSLMHQFDKKYLKLKTSTFNPPKNPIPGAGGTEIWTFTALAKGSASIALQYKRPWEKDIPPAKIYVYDISIK